MLNSYSKAFEALLFKPLFKPPRISSSAILSSRGCYHGDALPKNEFAAIIKLVFHLTGVGSMPGATPSSLRLVLLAGFDFIAQQTAMGVAAALETHLVTALNAVLSAKRFTLLCA